MALKLAKLYGTEEDKVNCPFYFKIGACRYGDKCLRIHNKPPYSQTILFKHMYQNLPVEISLASGNKVSEEEMIKGFEHFEEFYQEVFTELYQYGEIEDMIVSDNIGEHLLGNVYVKFANEEDAIRCLEASKIKYYEGRILLPEYCPVSDFSNAKCKQFIEGSCKRGGYCNYMHLKPVSREFSKILKDQMYEDYPEYLENKKNRYSRSRSSSRSRQRSKDRRKRSSSRDRKRQKSSRSRTPTKKHKKSSKSKDKKNKRSKSKHDKKDLVDDNLNVGELENQELLTGQEKVPFNMPEDQNLNSKSKSQEKEKKKKEKKDKKEKKEKKDKKHKKKDDKEKQEEYPGGILIQRNRFEFDKSSEEKDQQDDYQNQQFENAYDQNGFNQNNNFQN